MIPKTDATLVLEKALSLGADFAELFIEDRRELNIAFARKVDSITDIRLYGVGLYLMSGGRTVYTYANDTSLPALMRLCEKGCRLLNAKGDAAAKIPQFATVQIEAPNPVVRYPATVDHAEKIKLIQELDREIGSAGNDVKKPTLLYFDTDQNVTIANSEGVWAEDRRVTTWLRTRATIVGDDGASGVNTDTTGACGFEIFQDGRHLTRATRAIEETRAALKAEEAPSAFMPVVFDGGDCTGTFFHEACGHQFETTAIMNGGIFAGRIGEKVANEKVTLIDDGTMRHSFGSSKYDDEGMPRQKNVLIENGVMKSYLADRIGARRLNVARTGSGRRQSYAFQPSARMSNTYLAAGPDDPDEMIRSMPMGLYVTRLGGGQGGAEFTLAAVTSYLVKNGAIDRQVRGAILLGRGDVTMLKIDRVGSSLEFEEGGAWCGSVSGLCDTTSSGARMRVEGMLVGGKGGKK